jgi:1,4-alpha-glucan branching enzyme
MHAVRQQQRSPRFHRATIRAAAVLAVVVAAGMWYLVTTVPGTTSVGETTPFVQFVYVGPEAHAVSLVGSFNDWDPGANPLRREGPEGLWSAEVRLPLGHHEYAFNVDGRWIPDDDAPVGASDEFGVANSVILVQ